MLAIPRGVMYFSHELTYVAPLETASWLAFPQLWTNHHRGIIPSVAQMDTPEKNQIAQSRSTTCHRILFGSNKSQLLSLLLDCDDIPRPRRAKTWHFRKGLLYKYQADALQIPLSERGNESVRTGTKATINTSGTDRHKQTSNYTNRARSLF
jgi:hypothetical protein